MYEVLRWKDDVGDFVQLRDTDNKVRLFEDYNEAARYAAEYINSGIQAKVEYVRRQFIDKRPRKTMKSGRIKRFQTTVWAGERVKVIPVNSQGKIIRLKKGGK